MKTERSFGCFILRLIIVLGLTKVGFFSPTINAQCTAPPTGMVAWWPGDGNTDDLIGGNNGTLVGTVTFASGLVDQAFNFDGSSYVEVPDAPNLNFNPTSPITVEMWVFRTGNASGMHMIGKRSGCGAINYQMGLNTGSGEGLFFGNGFSDEVATGQDLPLNVWTHLAGTFDGTTYQFYINGVLVASAPGTLGSPVPAPLRIGTSGDCEKFQGLLDEIDIFARALSQAEIQAIFDAGASGKCKSGGAPVISSPLSATATRGVPFSYQIEASNNPTSFDAAPLPAGLTVNLTTGLISGTPLSTGSFAITLSATNGDGTGTAILALDVNPPSPVITSPSSAMGTATQPFSYQITATNSPTSFGATGLPAGLTVNTPTGLISGTPSRAGTFVIGLSATNAGGTGMADLMLTVNPASSLPTITSPLSASGTLGLAFSYQFETLGATSLSVIGLPAGLTFDSTLRAIVGIPAVEGKYQVGLSATNSNGTTTATLELTIQPLPGVGPVIASVTSATGRTGVPFQFQVMTTGGSIATQLTATGLPPGLFVDQTSGTIFGTATADGGFLVTLSVTEGGITNTATLELTFTSDPAVPVIVSPNSVPIFPDLDFSYTIVAPSSDSSDAITYSEIGTLPPGLGLDSGTGVISGTPLVHLSSQPAPLLAGGVISNVQIFACNSSGCAAQGLFFFLPTGAANISTRLNVGTEADVLIGGFIILGPAPMKLVVRGIGPGLPLGGSLVNPYLELYDNAGAILASNDNWKDNLTGGSQKAAIESTGLAPVNELESAVLAVLNPSAYTAIVRGVDNGTGVGLVEVYSLGAASIDPSSEAHLANISTRGLVRTGDNVMIGGFINQGSVPIKALIRGIGPSLQKAGISEALADPILELHLPDQSVKTSDDWMTADEAEIEATGLSPTDPRESAILITLPVGQGAYTAIVKGVNSTTGVGLVEAYFGDPCLDSVCP